VANHNVEETEMKKFFVINDQTHDVKTFDDPSGVATYLWGRDGAHYHVFIRQDRLPVEIREFEVELNRRVGDGGAKRYRYLGIGEVIQRGDEYETVYVNRWMPCKATIGEKVHQGFKVRREI
jgi:hypothetical protein